MPLPIRWLPIRKCRSLGAPPTPLACVGVFLWCRFLGDGGCVSTARRHVACGFIVLFFCFSFLCCHMAGPGRGFLAERSLVERSLVERSLRVTAYQAPPSNGFTSPPCNVRTDITAVGRAPSSHGEGLRSPSVGVNFIAS